MYAVLTLVYYNFSEQHRRAALGVLWMLISPALFLAVYLPTFSAWVGPEASAQLGGTYGFSLYVVVGLVCWTCFIEGLQGGAASLVSNPSLVQHSPIPLSVLPAVKVVSAATGLVLACTLLLGVCIWLGRFPGSRLFLFPLALVLFGAFILGLALFFSAVALAFRDVLQLIQTLLLIEFFAAPIVYLPSRVEGFPRTLTILNPLTPYLTLIRASLIEAMPWSWFDVACGAGWAAATLSIGWVVFRRASASAADLA